MNHNERNHSTLKEALQKLPQYAPPPSVWEEVGQALDKERPLRQAIRQLPAYSPPPSVWETIEESLEKKQPQRTWLVPIRAWAAAASVALLLGAFFLWPDGDPALKIEYAYEQTAEHTGLLNNDWDEDEALIRTVSREFSQDPVTRRHPEYHSMLEEWEELGDARTEIKDMIELYGKDARLIRQLVKVEQERSDMIQKMAAELLSSI